MGLQARAIGGHAQHLATDHRGVEQAVGTDPHMLGAFLTPQIDQTQTGQPGVRRMRALVTRRRQRRPARGSDRHRPEQQIHHQQRQQQQQSDSSLLHRVSPGCARRGQRAGATKRVILPDGSAPAGPAR